MKKNKLFLIGFALLTLTSCGNIDVLIGDTKLNDEIYHTCSLIYLDELKFFASFNFEDGIDYVSFKEANLDEFLKNRNFITGKDKSYEYTYVLDTNKKIPLNSENFDSTKSFNLYFY